MSHPLPHLSLAPGHHLQAFSLCRAQVDKQTALENVQWSQGQATAAEHEAILLPLRREGPLPHTVLSAHCRRAALPKFTLSQVLTYRLRTSLRQAPLPPPLVCHFTSSGPLDTSSSPSGCGKLAGVGMGQKWRAQGCSSRSWVWKKTSLQLRLFWTFPVPSLD